jgi:astacin
MTAALFIMTLATGCEKEPEPLTTISEVPNSSEEAIAKELKTWDDTLRWIKEESVNYEVHTDYLNEMPDPDAPVSGTEIIQVPDPRTGETVEMTAQIIDGQLIVDGDMNFGTEAEYRERLERAQGRGVIRSASSFRWEYGIIPYTIASNHPKKAAIETAIERINRETNLTVLPRNNEADFVHFPITDQLNSWVGRLGGQQNININNKASEGNIIHEIFHAAGMFHEQNRCDRDEYVNVLRSNVTDGYKHNFDRQCSGAKDTYSYNFHSIMHYGPHFFSKNGNATLLPKTSNPFTWLDQYFSMGNRSSITDTDQRTINYMYPFDYERFANGATFAMIPHHSRKPIAATGKEGEVMKQYQDHQAYAPYQRLKFIRASNGYFYIQHVRSGKYMTIESTEQWSMAVLRDPANNAQQQFRMEYAQDGLLKIQSRYSGLYLEIGGRNYSQGAHLNTWEYKSGDNQKFFFVYK